MTEISFAGRVVIVTGAGSGLGREYAKEFARRGANVVVNDLGSSLSGSGASDAAREVVAEIRSAGGTAIANGGSVANADEMLTMAEQTISEFGRIDVLIANAGILRDKSFRKMSIEDFDAVVGVHVLGTARSIKAVWAPMCDQGFGRIVVTTSTAGLFGNFGQSNYGAAKLGIVGLMNGLRLEGEKFGVHVNCISPFAATRMSIGLLSPEMVAVMDPKYVAPGVVWLASEDAPNGVILNAGAGLFSVVNIVETPGMAFLRDGLCAETVRDNWAEIAARQTQQTFSSAHEYSLILSKRMKDN